MTDNATSSKSSHVVYQIHNRGERSYWTRVGSAWPHADGGGFNVLLECVPLDGRVTLRVANDKKD